MPDFKRIKEAEAGIGGFWNREAMYWFRRYARNLRLIRQLRVDNRRLRSCLTQILNR